MGKVMRLASIALLGTGLYLGAQLEAKRLSATECAPEAVKNLAIAKFNDTEAFLNGLPLVNLGIEVRVPSLACDLLHGNGFARTGGVILHDLVYRVTGENPASTAIIVGQTDADLEAQKAAVNSSIERNKAYGAREFVSGLLPEFDPFKSPGDPQRRK